MPYPNGNFTPEELASMTPEERALYDQGLAAQENNLGRIAQNTDDAIKGRTSDPMARRATDGIPTELAGTAGFTQAFRAGANAAPNANPYSAIVANQARPAQEALYTQMRAQQAGPSLAAMQGTKAQGQNLQAALGAGGGRPVMAQAGSIGAGLAADTGTARLAEQLRGAQGIGGLATGVRSADLTVANAESNSRLQQRGLDDAMRQFYGGQGVRLTNANADLRNQRQIVADKALLTKQEDRSKKTDQAIETAGSIFGALFGM